MTKKKITKQCKNMNGKRMKVATVESSNAVSKALLLEKYQEKKNFAPRKNSYEIF